MKLTNQELEQFCTLYGWTRQTASLFRRLSNARSTPEWMNDYRWNGGRASLMEEMLRKGWKSWGKDLRKLARKAIHQGGMDARRSFRKHFNFPGLYESREV